MPEPVLEITDLRKRYGTTDAINGVSLTVESGELFGLLGPNGAGKTTLLSIASGLTRADSGTVKLFGKPFTRDDREPRRLIGLGTQDLSIYPDLTARENLRFFGKLYGLGAKELRTRVEGVLSAVGLTDRADDRVATFSGGMKRRLNLAAAIVHGPKLLLLDEPTTGVDPQSRNHIFEQVKALNAAGLTVIYCSHYMEEVQTLCPRIAILDGGLVRVCDTLPNLLKRLDATVRVTVANAPEGFAERLAAIPGVKRVAEEPPPPAPLGSLAGPVSGASRGPAEGKGEMPLTSPLEGEVGEALRAGWGASASEAPSALPPTRRVQSDAATFPSRGEVKTKAPQSFRLVAEDTGSVLAKIASACAASGAELTAASTTEPTLERVFLSLTGRELRD